MTKIEKRSVATKKPSKKSGAGSNLSSPDRAFEIGKDIFADDLRKARDSGLFDKVEETVRFLAGAFGLDINSAGIIAVVVGLKEQGYTKEEVETARRYLLRDERFAEKVRYRGTIHASDFIKAKRKAPKKPPKGHVRGFGQ